MTPMKRLTLTVALASALGSSTVPALEFSRTWFFGTSYLDSGAFVGNPDTVEGGKFTTNPGPVLSELLARKLGTSAVANNPDNPRTDPEGTNYAQGGAQVTNPLGYGQSPSPQHALPVRDQVDHYFESTARADRNALYVVAGGGNDIFYEMDRVAAGEISLDEALAYLGTSAADLAGQVQRLSDAGARYVMVPLVLDMEVFPAWVLETVAHAGEGNPAQGEALVAAGGWEFSLLTKSERPFETSSISLKGLIKKRVAEALRQPLQRTIRALTTVGRPCMSALWWCPLRASSNSPPS
ncbi:MAG: hypothetical protein DSZ01_05580 [Gammaproteobacteria bacterium]|nr:MAG: hypothetical protein DSZ01_05580 [Gammaproteobacteria bacterium]